MSTVLDKHHDWNHRGLPLLRFRLGIHTGVCLVGNFDQRPVHCGKDSPCPTDLSAGRSPPPFPPPDQGGTSGKEVFFQNGHPWTLA